MSTNGIHNLHFFPDTQRGFKSRQSCSSEVALYVL